MTAGSTMRTKAPPEVAGWQNGEWGMKMLVEDGQLIGWPHQAALPPLPWDPGSH
jgi:hypothetical protein